MRLTEAECERILACLPGEVVRHDLLDVIAACIDARLAPIRALADEWTLLARTAPEYDRDIWNAAAGVLHDALSAHESAPQPHDGAGSHGDDERAGDDDMCPNCVTPWKCNEPHLTEETR